MRDTLAAQPGVENVEVLFEARRAICKLAPSSKFDSKKAIAALDSEGFENSTVAK